MNGREREEAEREGGMTPVLYDDNNKCGDGDTKELEMVALSVVDQERDGDTQNDSGLVEDSTTSEEVMVTRRWLLAHCFMCLSVVCCRSQVSAGLHGLADGHGCSLCIV